MEIQAKTRAIAIGFLLWALAAPVLSQPEEKEFYEENERARYLVVRLAGSTTEGAGILFHVDDRYAYGITAKHVVYQQGKVVKDLKASFQAWPAKQFDAVHYKMDIQEDLAVFQVDLLPLGLSRQEVLRSIPLDMLGKSAKLLPGDELSCMGHATAGAWVTPKKWLRFARKEPNSNAFFFEYDCPQGHSGGAVFDKQWRLVGMMINEERPYCRALGIDSILKTVQAWKMDIDLHEPPPKERGPLESKRITVAVVGFDNRSAKDLPNLGAVAQDITSSSLYTLPGVVLVTRDRLDHVRQEVKLPDSVQTGTGISRVGKLLNADALVTGSILRYDVERRVFKGFDTSALMDIFRMEISLQILDVASGRVRFSKTFPVERIKQYPKETSAPSQPIDLTSELLTALINDAQRELGSALTQIAAGLGTANQLIRVPVTSRPAGADVILNGAFVGKTPYDLTVSPNVLHDLRLEMPGYESYTRSIRVEPGMTLDVILVSKLR
ncbi:MAG TPA: PEGA domain-containing protein [Thermoanaerobaculia bacterium]|nr:PEGA domain-containing protein [Thermoanaerobaculia bacterium]